MKIFKKMTRLDKIVLIVGLITVASLAISFIMDKFHEPDELYVDFENPYASIEDAYGEDIDNMKMLETVEVNDVVYVYYLLKEDDDPIYENLTYIDSFFIVNGQYCKVLGGPGNTQHVTVSVDSKLHMLSYKNISGKHMIRINLWDFEDVEIIDSYGNSGTSFTNDRFSESLFVYDKLDEDYHITIGEEVVYFYPELRVVKSEDLE